MCRNIKMLFNFQPPATDEEVAAAALQYVRKISGMRKPSRANQEAFDHAVAEITAVTRKLIDLLDTDAPARDRDSEARAARARGQQREERMRTRILAGSGGGQST
ncbi:MAG TPA: DUF2277 domain-containing protein [Haliangium sp.]|nr:DUF2277 domain-containing protein [Haliangium sp.]